MQNFRKNRDVIDFFKSKKKTEDLKLEIYFYINVLYNIHMYKDSWLMLNIIS